MRKTTVKQNKKSNFCDFEFVKKSNCDRHIKNIHGRESAAAWIFQQEKKNEETVYSQGEANNCEEDPTIFEITVLPTIIVFPNEGSTEDIVSGGERDKGHSNHKEEGKESDSESWQEKKIEKKRNVDAASSSFFQEDMMHSIIAQCCSTVEVTYYSTVYFRLVWRYN